MQEFTKILHKAIALWSIHIFMVRWAGTTYGSPPLRLSLQGTRHHLNNFIPELLAATSTKRLQIYCTLLKVITHKTVSVDAFAFGVAALLRLVVRHRPDISEAQIRKRRPKIYPLMTKPRHELRKQLQTP
ncbi:hypothetical protein [Nostoc sp.]|uniref:hypothetical protein n=1 Tax=Nostoc sp. TaxID=1180 RepID=UPI002FF4AC90